MSSLRYKSDFFLTDLNISLAQLNSMSCTLSFRAVTLHPFVFSMAREGGTLEDGAG